MRKMTKITEVSRLNDSGWISDKISEVAKRVSIILNLSI